MVSTGFCGALDPALRVGDIVVAGRVQRAAAAGAASDAALQPANSSLARSCRRDVARKTRFAQQTGAVAVEMEAAAVARKAAEWNVPFYCIRVGIGYRRRDSAAWISIFIATRAEFLANADRAGGYGAAFYRYSGFDALRSELPHGRSKPWEIFLPTADSRLVMPKRRSRP